MPARRGAALLLAPALCGGLVGPTALLPPDVALAKSGWALQEGAQPAAPHPRTSASSGANASANASSSARVDPPCDILYAVLTGAEHHADRAATVKRTWCSAPCGCIFFSDAPSDELSTVSISVDGLPPGLSVYNRAQLRYLPALHYVRGLLRARATPRYREVKWLILVDDDTFVFRRNLRDALAPLNPSTPVYTGDVVPDDWLPITRDGAGHELGVSSSTPFVNGGGGSVFSTAALLRMDTEGCVNASLPDRPWWRWQSDWMIGACAAAAGIRPLRQPDGRFNQFACTDASVQFCDGVYETEYDRPATLHPMRSTARMAAAWGAYANSADATVPSVIVRMPEKSDAPDAAAASFIAPRGGGPPPRDRRENGEISDEPASGPAQSHFEA